LAEKTIADGLESRAEKVLVLGGSRSGKSQFALEFCQKINGRRMFIATCQPLDREMEDRIALHRKKRAPSWETVEEFWNLADQLARVKDDYRVILIDCLTLWLSNCLMRDITTALVEESVRKLTEMLRKTPIPVVMVSNEVGMGVIPPSPLGRVFRDLQGILNQEIAAMADQVFLMTAGIPLRLK
jgi:adenosylcobinamide kinase / adenosylcobinamide-phosphate guanylyltransferase